MNGQIEKLREMVRGDNRIVFFGGAGVSTESGIPDFRSKDGLYHQKYSYDPEYLLSLSGFRKYPEVFWKFYRERILLKGIVPNKGHLALAKLERMGKLKAVVTQNIDNLHELAGSEVVHHLHGTVMTNHCTVCKKNYLLAEIEAMDVVARCSCGGMIKPDVVFFEEMLPEEAWVKSVDAIRGANTLIVAGTSLTVYPAASLLEEFGGANLVIINRDATRSDERANLIIRESIAGVLDAVV